MTFAMPTDELTLADLRPLRRWVFGAPRSVGTALSVMCLVECREAGLIVPVLGEVAGAASPLLLAARQQGCQEACRAVFQPLSPGCLVIHTRHTEGSQKPLGLFLKVHFLVLK